MPSSGHEVPERKQIMRSASGPPHAGGYIAIPLVSGDDLADSETKTYRHKIPAGMRLVLTGVCIASGAVVIVGGSPTVILGDAGDANGYLTAKNITAAAVVSDIDGALATLISTRVVVEDSVEVRCVVASAGANSSASDVTVTAWGYVVEHADNTDPTGDGLKADIPSNEYI